VRSAAIRRRHSDDDADVGAARGPRPLWWRVLVRNPRDTLVGLAAAAAMTAIIVNSLFLQPGPHPAPFFTIRSPIAEAEPTGTVVMMPRPRPAIAEPTRAVAPVAPVARTRGDIVIDIQRELARRGFYDGTVDGLYGAKTDAAIRDFEQAAGIKTPGEPSETLLQAIQRSTVKGRLAAASVPTPTAAPRRDPIAGLIAPAPVAALPAPAASAPTPPAAPSAPTPSRQVMAVQRALGDFGYGQVRATGLYDPDTRVAIERFERARSLPVTGQVSERLIRELGAMTGRPLD
jgi:peptidoglycan hydrolase-like protein with peptidoglycan-binding domain